MPIHYWQLFVGSARQLLIGWREWGQWVELLPELKAAKVCRGMMPRIKRSRRKLHVSKDRSIRQCAVSCRGLGGYEGSSLSVGLVSVCSRRFLTSLFDFSGEARHHLTRAVLPVCLETDVKLATSLWQTLTNERTDRQTDRQ